MLVRKLAVGFNTVKSLQGDICRDIILLCPHWFSYIIPDCYKRNVTIRRNPPF